MPRRYPDSCPRRSDELDLPQGRVGEQGHHVDERCAWGWQIGDRADGVRDTGWGRRIAVVGYEVGLRRQVRCITAGLRVC